MKKEASSRASRSKTKTVREAGAAPELAETNYLLGHYLRRAHLAISRKFNENVGRGGLRPGQFGLLSAIDHNPGISQIAASRLLDLDKAAIVALTLKMEKDGWLIRKQDPEDRRRHQLFTTSEGRRALKTLREGLQVHEDKYRERFTAKEYTQFIDFLQRIYLDET